MRAIGLCDTAIIPSLTPRLKALYAIFLVTVLRGSYRPESEREILTYSHTTAYYNANTTVTLPDNIKLIGYPIRYNITTELERLKKELERQVAENAKRPKQTYSFKRLYNSKTHSWWRSIIKNSFIVIIGIVIIVTIYLTVKNCFANKPVPSTNLPLQEITAASAPTLQATTTPRVRFFERPPQDGYLY